MPTDPWILGVGVATLDIVSRVARYPGEDEEVRALAQWSRRGGNVANTLTVLRQFGRACAWVGTHGADPAAALILAELARAGIATDRAVAHASGLTPISCITLSQATGSRAIVHYRDLPELDAGAFARVPLDGCVWAHFEGRNPEQTARMVERVRRERPDLPISIEIEKPRPGIEQLLLPVSALLLSRGYCAALGTAEPSDLLRALQARSGAALCIAPWGAAGAHGIAADGQARFAPAYRPPRVIDTLAAGDAFNAAIIDGLLDDRPLDDLLGRANRLAGHKCGRDGLDGLVASAVGLLD